MIPFGKQQEILDFLFDDKSRRAVGRRPGLCSLNFEPPEASFGFPIATDSTFRNFGAMVRIPVVCSIMS